MDDGAQDEHGGKQENPTWPSVDDAAPLEEGGPVARKGFNYQDEVAVSVLLDMMDDQSIIKVHCETHDDILILRSIDDWVLI